jgi:hypothetical protein
MCNKTTSKEPGISRDGEATIRQACPGSIAVTVKFLICAITPIVSTIVLRTTEVIKEVLSCCIEVWCWIGAMLGKCIDGKRDISSGAHRKVQKLSDKLTIISGEIQDVIVDVGCKTKGILGIERQLDWVAIKEVHDVFTLMHPELMSWLQALKLNAEEFCDGPQVLDATVLGNAALNICEERFRVQGSHAIIDMPTNDAENVTCRGGGLVINENSMVNSAASEAKFHHDCPHLLIPLHGQLLQAIDGSEHKPNKCSPVTLLEALGLTHVYLFLQDSPEKSMSHVEHIVVACQGCYEAVKKRNLNCGENTNGKMNAVSPECEI